MRKILQIGDPLLEKLSMPVKDINDPKVQKLIDDLLEIMKIKSDLTAGISAPQVGENLCVCITRRMDLEEETDKPLPFDTLWEIMINPVVLNVSEKKSTYWEGCLSVGEGPNGLFGPVSRPKSIKIKYKTREGKDKTLECDGFYSHVVQHEFDHIQGVLFVKYVSDPQNIWKSSDLDKYYQKHGSYPEVN